MRTAILMCAIGLWDIGDAIRGRKHSEESGYVFAIILFVCVLMDVIDFLR